MLKKHRRAEDDIRAFEKELAKRQLFELGDAMQGRPADMPELWKFRIALKSENIGSKAGLRLIGVQDGGVLFALAIYTHAEFDPQPPWADMRNWVASKAS